MHEIYAADSRLTIEHIRVSSTQDEIAVWIGGARFITRLAGTGPEQIRQDAAFAAECASAWQRMSSVLAQEADRRDIQLRAAAAAAHALREAAAVGTPPSPGGGNAEPAAAAEDADVRPTPEAAEAVITSPAEDSAAQQEGPAGEPDPASPLEDLMRGVQVTAPDPDGWTR